MSTTETKVRHTHTPWSLGENGDGCAKKHAIVAGGMVIAKVYGRGYPSGAGWHPQSEADAEFIVRAVNSHADMLEALELMTRRFAEAYDDLTDSDDSGSHPEIKRARAAIAKAKGGA